MHDRTLNYFTDKGIDIIIKIIKYISHYQHFTEDIRNKSKVIFYNKNPSIWKQCYFNFEGERVRR